MKNSSAKSTFTAFEEDRSETRDSSCYYPGCRKDANCDCEICLASINATLDLMPFSIQKSSLTKLSASNPSVERTPVSFDHSILSTPRSSTCRIPESPSLKSTARLNLNMKEKVEKKERKWGFGGVFLRLILALGLLFGAEIGFSWGVNGVLRPALSPETVARIGERSWVMKDLNGRMRFLQRELQNLVDGRVTNCSYINSIWEINQDGLLLNSRCTLYKSAMEEVSIWGWPLQTAGLLSTGFSSRSFTIISGRVTEWRDGNVGYSIRKANNSWVHRKWSASVVQLDSNTWVLEYRRNSLSENSRLFSTALELLKHRVSGMVGKMKQELWMFSVFDNQYSEFAAREHIKIPT